MSIHHMPATAGLAFIRYQHYISISFAQSGATLFCDSLHQQVSYFPSPIGTLNLHKLISRCFPNNRVGSIQKESLSCPSWLYTENVNEDSTKKKREKYQVLKKHITSWNQHTSINCQIQQWTNHSINNYNSKNLWSKLRLSHRYFIPMYKINISWFLHIPSYYIFNITTLYLHMEEVNQH